MAQPLAAAFTEGILVDAFEQQMARGGQAALEFASLFFMRKDPVHQALTKFARRVEELDIPYAVCGGMALVAHGYTRTTVDVDVLVTPDGLQALHENLAGLGYRPVFPGSKQLRDTQHGVRIEFLIAGEFPGDGEPKPISFPDPSAHGLEIDGVRYLDLPTLIELKLASGMSNLGRLKDLADVQELIRVLGLDEGFQEKIHPYVRERFLELLRGVQGDRPR